MPHDVSLIATVAAGFALALALGYVATRLGMPPLVGYLLAGVAIGPATPGFVADVGLADRSNAWVESAEEGEGSVRVVLGATEETEGVRRTVQLAVGGRPVLNAFVEDGETSFRFDPPAGSYEAEVRVSAGGALTTGGSMVAECPMATLLYPGLQQPSCQA